MAAEKYEFGGPVGALFLIVWSHYILFYFWYCLEEANGQMVIPLSIEELQFHSSKFWNLLVAYGFNMDPTVWVLYFGFFFVQILLAFVVPGVTTYGLPTESGKRLVYHCNGYLCYYICLWGTCFSHFIGIIPLSYYVDHYGSFLVASMVISNVTSVFWYFYGICFYKKENGDRSGNVLYDFFIGTVLYPRLGEVDIKMLAEVRWSWLTLMILTMSSAYKQYETLGYITKEMGIMLLAHWLYSNATVKGEQLIPATWDMFHEKFGWMLNFWNVTGVPFLYCFQSMFILRHGLKISETMPVPYVAFLYILLLAAYYVFDTANSQKALFKLPHLKRNTFPQLPWGQLAEPVACLETPKGRLLIDGWYRYARKIQYTADLTMALVWGLSCGFLSPLPYFYFLFFLCMITHRQMRDEEKCREKYGTSWDEYVSIVPNVFIPRIPPSNIASPKKKAIDVKRE